MNLGTGAAWGKERAKRPRGELSAPPHPWPPSGKKEGEDRKGEEKKQNKGQTILHDSTTKQQVRREEEEKARGGGDGARSQPCLEPAPC